MHFRFCSPCTKLMQPYIMFNFVFAAHNVNEKGMLRNKMASHNFIVVMMR